MEEIKPIHKLNGGRGATLCNECNVIISTGFTADLYCEEHGGKPKSKYKLVRTRDNLTKYGNKLTWVGWNEDGTFKEQYDEPTVGASLVLDFRILMGFYEWMTTSIVSFSEQDECLTITTKNSEYKLYQL
jgi:hypothetical protein